MKFRATSVEFDSQETHVIGQFPHCDARILHGPGECQYCDTYPEWQELRDAWGINYTGEYDPAKWPCPADAARGASLTVWPGNRAKSLLGA